MRSPHSHSEVIHGMYEEFRSLENTLMDNYEDQKEVFSKYQSLLDSLLKKHEEIIKPHIYPAEFFEYVSNKDDNLWNRNMLSYHINQFHNALIEKVKKIDKNRKLHVPPQKNAEALRTKISSTLNFIEANNSLSLHDLSMEMAEDSLERDLISKSLPKDMIPMTQSLINDYVELLKAGSCDKTAEKFIEKATERMEDLYAIYTVETEKYDTLTLQLRSPDRKTVEKYPKYRNLAESTRKLAHFAESEGYLYSNRLELLIQQIEAPVTVISEGKKKIDSLSFSIEEAFHNKMTLDARLQENSYLGKMLISCFSSKKVDEKSHLIKLRNSLSNVLKKVNVTSNYDSLAKTLTDTHDKLLRQIQTAEHVNNRLKKKLNDDKNVEIMNREPKSNNEPQSKECKEIREELQKGEKLKPIPSKNVAQLVKSTQIFANNLSEMRHAFSKDILPKQNRFSKHKWLQTLRDDLNSHYLATLDELTQVQSLYSSARADLLRQQELIEASSSKSHQVPAQTTLYTYLRQSVSCPCCERLARYCLNSCGHAICAVCLKKLFASHSGTCPACKQATNIEEAVPIDW